MICDPSRNCAIIDGYVGGSVGKLCDLTEFVPPQVLVSLTGGSVEQTGQACMSLLNEEKRGRVPSIMTSNQTVGRN